MILNYYDYAYEWLNEHDLAFWKHCNDCPGDILHLLVEKGLNVNNFDRFHYTPLHIACYMNKSELATSLIEVAGATVDILNRYSCTPIFKACIKGYFDIVQLLVEHRANIDIYDDKEITPLMYALKHKHRHLLPIFRHTYSNQYLITPPTLTSYPNHNIFSQSHITHADYLLYVLCHRMSSLEIEGYMDNIGFYINGMRDLVSRFPNELRLLNDKKREYGLKVRVISWELSHECSMALLWWESEEDKQYTII